jgi:hypothetical protein
MGVLPGYAFYKFYSLIPVFLIQWKAQEFQKSLRLFKI